MKRIVFLIVLCLIIAGCVQTQMWPPSSVSDCKSMKETSSFDHTKEECYRYFAIKNGDASLCEFSEKGELRRCILQVAVKNNDVSACKMFGDADTRGLCIASIVKQTGDYKPCFEIKHTRFRHNCFYQCGDELDAKPCGQNQRIDIDGESRVVNFLNTPRKFPEKDCAGVIDTWASNSPMGRKRGCIESLSKEKVDPLICQKGDHEPMRDTCLYFYALYYIEEDICNGLREGPYNDGYTDMLGVNKNSCLEVINHFK